MNQDNELNQNQEQFCNEFTTIGQETFGNATKAYRAAYPDTTNDNSAAASASALLRNPKIQARINEIHKENLTRNGVTIESVLANIQHDRMNARQAGLWSVAAQLDKLEGQYLAMFTDNINQPDQYRPVELSPELIELLQAEAKKKLSLININGGWQGVCPTPVNLDIDRP